MGALGRGLLGAHCRLLSPFSSLDFTKAGGGMREEGD